MFNRCDADPTALAKYVLALLKKDKPQSELEGCMAEQLDVFLGKETKPFLEKLFVVMKSLEYMQIDSRPSESAVVPHEATPMNQTSTGSLPVGARKSKEPAEEVKVDRATSSTSITKKIAVSPPSKSKSQEPLSKSLSESRDIRRRRISNRSKSHSRSKSRSRSKSAERLERIRRSRSRDRRMAEHVRDKNARPYRNNSPPVRRYDHRKNDRVSPKYNRNPARTIRSRSSSPVPAYRKSPTAPRSEELFDKQNKRCRDFDEKGYCMRGETCPWDHGVDPVVLEDLSNPPLAMNQPSMNMRNGQIHSEYNPDNPDLWTRGPPGFGPSGNRMHLPVPAPRPPYFGFRGGPPMGFQLPPGVAPLPRELIPVPVMDPNHPGDMGAHMKRRFEPEDGVALPEGKRKMPINSRLGPRINQSGGPANSAQNCSLELRKIPRGLNAISHLNDHFSKFGKITNIQIAYEGDPEAAIVTFSAHAEANVAYRSTEAVLNNRFIKVFWHSGSGTGENQTMNGPSGSLPKISELSVRRFPYQQSNPQASQATSQVTPTSSSVGDSTNTASAPQASTTAASNQDPATSNIGSIAPKGSTTYINAASPAAQQAQQRLKTVKANKATNDMIHKKQKEQHKNAVEVSHVIYQKKQELLQKYIVQLKPAVDKLERTDPLDPARPQLLTFIKDLQITIDKLRQELKSDSVQIVAKTQPTTPQRKTKEQQQKELLDVELELISKEQHGDDDTYAIKKRYIELQKSLNRPHFPGVGGQRPAATRPTVARYGSTLSVDRRPTSIQITGFAAEDSDAVLGHFKVSFDIEILCTIFSDVFYSSISVRLRRMSWMKLCHVLCCLTQLASTLNKLCLVDGSLKIKC